LSVPAEHAGLLTKAQRWTVSVSGTVVSIVTVMAGMAALISYTYQLG